MLNCFKFLKAFRIRSRILAMAARIPATDWPERNGVRRWNSEASTEHEIFKVELKKTVLKDSNCKMINFAQKCSRWILIWKVLLLKLKVKWIIKKGLNAPENGHENCDWKGATEEKLFHKISRFLKNFWKTITRAKILEFPFF